MSKTSKTRSPPKILDLIYDNKNKFEICLDEVGRGCLFGRAYIGCVVLPKDGSFDGKDIKDSKKFSSKKKIKEVAEYIKQNAVVWHIEYVESELKKQVTDKDVDAKAKEIIDSLKDKNEVKISHILVESEEIAKDIISRIKK